MSAAAEAATTSNASTMARLATVPWTPLLRRGGLALAALALAVGAARGEPQAIVTALIGLAIGVGLIRLTSAGSTREFLLTLFIVAFTARVAAAVGLHLLLFALGRDGNLLLDDRAYDKLGWTLARVWMGIFPGIRDTDQYLMVNWTYMIGTVYLLLGKSLLAAKMLMVTAGALLAIVLYALTREVFSERSARIAALIGAFFPSMFLWSLTTLKDILTVLLTVVVAYGVLRYAKRHSWWALVLGVAAFLALENMRQFVFFILAWLIPVAFLFADRSEAAGQERRLLIATVLGVLLTLPIGQYLWASRDLHPYLLFLPLALLAPAYLLFAGTTGGRRKLLLLTPLLVAVMAFGFVTNNEKLGVNFLTPKALSSAEWKRWLEEQKALSGFDQFDDKPLYRGVGEFEIVSRNMAAMPRNILLVIFGPTPFDLRSGMTRAVLPEMLLWYAILLAAGVGLVRSFRQSWRDLVLPLGFSLAWILALALTEGNLGNTFRHRSQFMPFVFMLAATGLIPLSDWLTGRFFGRKSPEIAATRRPLEA